MLDVQPIPRLHLVDRTAALVVVVAVALLGIAVVLLLVRITTPWDGTGRLPEALGDRRAVLLRNHGMCAVGSTLKEAVQVAVLVERVAQIFIYGEMSSGIVELPEYAVDAERQVYLMRTGLEGTE